MYIWTWLECFQIYADHHLDQGGTLEELERELRSTWRYEVRWLDGTIQVFDEFGNLPEGWDDVLRSLP